MFQRSKLNTREFTGRRIKTECRAKSGSAGRDETGHGAYFCGNTQSKTRQTRGHAKEWAIHSWMKKIDRQRRCRRITGEDSGYFSRLTLTLHDQHH
jgi:hypothetical protein